MKKFISILLCIFWMGFIFYNSSENGMSSDGLSYKIVDKFISVKDAIFSSSSDLTGKLENNKKVYSGTNFGLTGAINSAVKSNDRYVLNQALRKLAHFTEYLILALLVANAFNTFKKRPKDAIIYILFIVLFYAVTDEYHQLFIDGRNSKITDVLIDFTGGIIGMIMFYTLYHLKGKKKRFSK